MEDEERNEKQSDCVAAALREMDDEMAAAGHEVVHYAPGDIPLCGEDIGHRVAPLQPLTVQTGVVGETYAGPHIAPHVLDTALDLALGLGPVGLAQLRAHMGP